MSFAHIPSLPPPPSPLPSPTSFPWVVSLLFSCPLHVTIWGGCRKSRTGEVSCTHTEPVLGRGHHRHPGCLSQGLPTASPKANSPLHCYISLASLALDFTPMQSHRIDPSRASFTRKVWATPPGWVLQRLCSTFYRFNYIFFPSTTRRHFYVGKDVYWAGNSSVAMCLPSP